MSNRLSTSTIRLADGTDLVITQHFTTVTPRGHYEPDPGWQDLDEAGHLHAWVGKLLPTLEERWDEYDDDGYWPDEDPEPESLGHFCKACGEGIRPGMQWVEEKLITIPGLREISRQGILRFPATEGLPEVKMKWVMAFGCSPSSNFAEICQPLTPAEAVDVVEAIGLPERSLTLKSNLISMLRGLISGGVDSKQPEADVLPVQRAD